MVVQPLILSGCLGASNQQTAAPAIGHYRVLSATFGLFSRVLVHLLSFTHFPNAATDAAISYLTKCRKPRVSGAMVLVLLSIFVVAGG